MRTQKLVSFGFALFVLAMMLGVCGGAEVYLSDSGSETWDGGCDGTQCQRGNECFYPTVSIDLNSSCSLVLGFTSGDWFSVSASSHVGQLNITTSEEITTSANQEWRFDGLATEINVFGLDAIFGGNIIFNATAVSIVDSSFTLTGSSSQKVSGFGELKYLNTTVEKSSSGSNNAFEWSGQDGAIIDAVDLRVEFFSAFNTPTFLLNPTTQRLSFRKSKLNVTYLWRIYDPCPSSVSIEETTINTDLAYAGFFDCTYQVGASQFIRSSSISNINPSANNCSQLTSYPTNGYKSSFYWSDVRLDNLAIGFTYNPLLVFAEHIHISCPDDVTSNIWSIVMDASANTTLTLRNLTMPIPPLYPPIQIQGPSYSGYSYTILTLDDLWSFYSVASCPFDISGRFMFTAPTVVSAFCISSYQVIHTLGSPLEITNQVLCRTALPKASWHSFNEQTILNPILLSGIDAVIDHLVYVPQVPEIGIANATEATLSIGDIFIDWRFSYDPPVDVPFLLSHIISSYSTFEGFLVPGVYNLSNATDATTVTFTFGSVPCNVSCIFSHLPTNPICASSLQCPCDYPWGGPYCACNASSIPEGASCSSSGNLQWDALNGFSLPAGQVLVIPDNYTFVINGNTTISGELVLTEGTSLIANGFFISEGVLSILCKLRERHVSPESCSVYSTVSVISNALIFTGLNHVELVLDVSELSTDGSCVQPLDIDIFADTTFKSLSTTTFQGLDITWNITFVTGSGSKRSALSDQDIAKLKFNTSLVMSNDTSKSIGEVTTLLVATPSPETCGSFSSAPGQLSLFVSTCPSSSNPQDKSKSSIKWWWYGIPIIAVVVIASLIVVLVFTVGSAKGSVLPYHGSDGK